MLRNPFAAEILKFYVQIARFQDGVHERLCGSASSIRGASFGEVASETIVLNFPESVNDFRKFLSSIEQHGPDPTRRVTREVLNLSREAQIDLLDSVWQDFSEPPSTPDGFLALAFLQPYAEFLRRSAQIQLSNYADAICFFCNRKPAFGLLRPLGDGAQRKLVCGFCLAEWDFRRISCPECGEEDPSKLPVYTAEIFAHIRVECCDSCHAYIKCVDLTKNGLAEALVDELASIPLNLWAEERGYGKIYPNLLGM